MPNADQLSALERLSKLRESGALSEDEFAAQKATILSGAAAPTEHIPFYRRLRVRQATKSFWFGKKRTASKSATAKPEFSPTPPKTRATAQQCPTSDPAIEQSLWKRCQSLAEKPDILAELKEELSASGYAGDTKPVELIYLALTSRVLDKPVSVAVMGASAAGKSYCVEQVLRLMPTKSYLRMSSSSPLALAYEREQLAHRMLVITEASGLSNPTTIYHLRTLLSEGEVRHKTVQNRRTETTVIKGPVGLIVTTTGALHPENETRVFAVTIEDGPEQTKAVLEARARSHGNPQRRPAQSVTREWLALQSWLAVKPAKVFVPYANTLASMIPPVATRLARDIDSIFELIKACALLHQATRDRNEDGWIVAKLDDYRQVRRLVGHIVGEAAEASVPPTVRETVEAVETLEHLNLWEGVSVTQIATQLRLNKATASRRVDKAIALGYLRNFERRAGVPARVRLADPMPKKDVPVLPETKALREAIAKRLQAKRTFRTR